MTNEEILVRTERRIHELEAKKEIHDLRIEEGLDFIENKLLATDSFMSRYIAGLININEALSRKLRH